MDEELLQIRERIYQGDADGVIRATEQALRSGIGLEEIMQGALFPAMEHLGEEMQNNGLSVPEVLRASRAMQAAMYVLRPIITHSGMPTKGLVVIGTVAGDLHDVGKNIVSMMLSGYGYTVVDLGVDVTKEQFADAVVQYHPDVVAMSALLTTTMEEMARTISYLEEKHLRAGVKIAIGGAPTTMAFARAIGADAYTANAFELTEAVDDLLAGRIGRHSTKYTESRE